MPKSPVWDRKKAETRALIVTVAGRLFVEHGYDAVTLERVARECEVSVRTVLNYFASKEALLFARHHDSLAAFREALAAGNNDVIGCWRAFIEEGLAEIASEPVPLRRSLNMTEGHPVLRSHLQGILRDFEDLLADAFAKEAGGTSELWPRLLAAMLVGGHGAVTRDWVRGDRPFDPQIFRRVIDDATKIFAAQLPPTARRPRRR